MIEPDAYDEWCAKLAEVLTADQFDIIDTYFGKDADAEWERLFAECLSPEDAGPMLLKRANDEGIRTYLIDFGWDEDDGDFIHPIQAKFSFSFNNEGWYVFQSPNEDVLNMIHFRNLTPFNLPFVLEALGI